MTSADSDPESGSALRRQLSVHPFLRDLSPEWLDAIEECAEPARFDSGEVIFHEDGEADRFYLLRSGLVAIELETGTRPGRTIQLLHEGDALGWSWLFPPHRWQFTARAQSPVQAIVLDAAKLRALFDTNQQLAYQLLLRLARVISERLSGTRRQIIELDRP